MENLENLLKSLAKTGTNSQELKKISNSLKEDIKKNKSIDDILNEIIQNINEATKQFLYAKNEYGIKYITGISSSIYIPSFDDSGEIKLSLYGGDRSRIDDENKINIDTMFDVASITKLFTLVLTFKLAELNIINLNDKIVDINPDFKGLEDFTFNDLIKLHGQIHTNDNIANAKNEQEAYEMLKTAWLKDNNKNTNKYTDFGAIIIGKTLEKIMSERENRNVTLQELMDKYIFSKINMKKTMFNPITYNISGNGGYTTHVHDPKSYKLGGIVGSAGLFTTSDDLCKFAKGMFKINYINLNKLESIISRSNLIRLGQITYPNSDISYKGNLGVFVKNSQGLGLTYTSNLLSNNSFSHQGWVGSVASFDPNNLIHFNGLVNAIYETDDKSKLKNDKPIGYKDRWIKYQKEVINNAMLLMIAKKYFNMYKDVKIEINETINYNKKS